MCRTTNADRSQYNHTNTPFDDPNLFQWIPFYYNSYVPYFLIFFCVVFFVCFHHDAPSVFLSQDFWLAQQNVKLKWWRTELRASVSELFWPKADLVCTFVFVGDEDLGNYEFKQHQHGSNSFPYSAFFVPVIFAHPSRDTVGTFRWPLQLFGTFVEPSVRSPRPKLVSPPTFTR